MIEIRKPTEADYPFVEKLMVSNMLPYYQRHRMQFSKIMYAYAYKLSENYIITHNGVEVGFMRLDQDKKSLHIADLQVSWWMRNAGVGTFALEFVHALAKERKLKFVTLHVFNDNPAANLYFRNGYRWIMGQDDGPLRKMVREN